MAQTVIFTGLYVSLFVFCKLTGAPSKSIPFSSEALLFPSPSTSFCPVVLICARASGTLLVSLFSSSQGENQGTPTQKWDVQFCSLKIIGLCSIKAQRCAFDPAGSVIFSDCRRVIIDV